jgi:hypothetical protein
LALSIVNDLRLGSLNIPITSFACFWLVFCFGCRTKTPSAEQAARVVPVIYQDAWRTGEVFVVQLDGGVYWDQSKQSLKPDSAPFLTQIYASELSALLVSTREDPRWRTVGGVPSIVYGVDSPKGSYPTIVDRIYERCVDALHARKIKETNGKR